MAIMAPRDFIRKFEESSRREQVLIGLAGAVVVVFLLHILFLEPMMNETEKVKRRVISLSNTQISLQNKLTSEPKEKNELARKRQELEVQKRKVNELDHQLEAMSSLLVSPDVMPNLLQSLVSQSNMELVAFENLPPRPLVAPEFTESAGELGETKGISQVGKPLQLFRHGISLRLRGTFENSFRYLENVESKPWQFMWDSFDYEVEDYPNGNLTIKIETLSAEQRWLGV